MDSELFTVGGKDSIFERTKFLTRDAVESKDVMFAQVKIMRTWRQVGHLVWFALVVYIIHMILVLIPVVASAWKNGFKSDFTQKEGLQYLGASTNVILDDLGRAQVGSADELWRQTQAAASETSMAAKATFVVPRERMDGKEETPEEKLMKKQYA